MNDEARLLEFDEAFQAEFRTLLAWYRDVRQFRRDALPDVRETLAAHVDAMNLRAAQTYDATRAVAYRTPMEILTIHAATAPEPLAGSAPPLIAQFQPEDSSSPRP